VSRIEYVWERRNNKPKSKAGEITYKLIIGYWIRIVQIKPELLFINEEVEKTSGLFVQMVCGIRMVLNLLQ
jgi:hypothetical protein